MAYPNIFFTIDNFDEVSAFTINSCFGRVLYRRTDRHTLLSMQERIWKGGSCWTDCVFTLNLSSQVFTDIVIRDGEVVCVELLARDKSKQFSSVLFIGSIKYEALRWVSNCPRDWQLLRLFWKYWRNEMPFNFLLCFGWSCLNERLIRLSRFVWLECFLSFFFVFFSLKDGCITITFMFIAIPTLSVFRPCFSIFNRRVYDSRAGIGSKFAQRISWGIYKGAQR